MCSKKVVTIRQIELLTDFMEQHKDLALGRVRSKEGRALSQRLWAKVSDILNAEDVGNSYRTPKDWNKFYNDYKCRIKSKVRRKNQSMNKTGGGPADEIPLTPLEERLSAIIGPDKFQNLPVQHNPVAEETIEQAEDNIILLENQQIIVEDYVVEPSTSKSTPLLPNNQILSSTPPLQECNKQQLKQITYTPPRIKRHKDSELENTKNILIKIEEDKIETQKQMIEIEKDKVLAINNLANAVWAIANGLKDPEQTTLKRKLIYNEDDSD